MCALQLVLVAVWFSQFTTVAQADSSSPLLHGYYDQFVAIVNGTAYAWREGNKPKPLTIAKPIQVGSGSRNYYVLSSDKILWRLESVKAKPAAIAKGVKAFAAGRSGVFIIDEASTLWWQARGRTTREKISNHVIAAAVGDSANYFIDRNGGLFVKGLAHRGQYCDGKLRSTKTFVQTASEVLQVRAHTGHAILLKENGDVFGTGGNIYGPVGKHGLGDKAVRWSPIVSGMKAVATGASHSLAIRKDGALFAWGSGYGVDPRQIMTAIAAVAAGSQSTIALGTDGTLWQWKDAEQPRQLILN